MTRPELHGVWAARHRLEPLTTSTAPDRADQNRSTTKAASGIVRAHVVDVTEEDGVERLAVAVLGMHGRVGVLVNNVGDFRPWCVFRSRRRSRGWRCARSIFITCSRSRMCSSTR
jgi:NAD(P)-dependent dehydrogenase (short-subunit alcohol dehydrogenase family)